MTVLNKTAKKTQKKTQEKPSCAICCETLNCSSHKLIACTYCQFEACRECCQTFVLNEPLVKCMNTTCGKEWPRKFINSAFTTVFVSKQLKAHRENILYEKDLALMPATQPYAEYQVAMRPLDKEHRALLLSRAPLEKAKAEVSKKIYAIQEKISIIEIPITKLWAQERRQLRILTDREEQLAMMRDLTAQRVKLSKVLEPEIKPLKEENYILRTQELRPINRELKAQFKKAATDIKFKRRAAVQALRAHTHPLATDATDATGPLAVERRQFIKPCPADDCRGFLSSQWKCGLCTQWTCPDCHVVIGESKDAPHTCDPNDVETAKMLKAETKPCPKCHSAIFKIDGCDQIWCTQCHTAFSWNTGNIETKIHNPHYYEWLRKTQGAVPRDPNDIPCDRRQEFDHHIVNDIHAALAVLNVRAEWMDKTMQNTRSIVREAMHLRALIRDRFTNRTADYYEKKNRALRVDYMLKNISLANFKKTLQEREKKAQKEAELRDVYETVATAAEDIMVRFRGYLTAVPFDNRPFNIRKEMTALTAYANECLEDISKTYKCVKCQFSPLGKLLTGKDVVAAQVQVQAQDAPDLE